MPRAEIGSSGASIEYIKSIRNIMASGAVAILGVASEVGYPKPLLIAAGLAGAFAGIAEIDLHTSQPQD